VLSKEKKEMLAYLVASGRLSEDHRDVLMMEIEQSENSIESLLLDMEILTEEELLTLYHRIFNVPIVELKKYHNEIKSLSKCLPYPLWEQALALPIGGSFEENHLTIAMVDVWDINSYDCLKRTLPENCQVSRVMGRKSEILSILQEIAPPPEVSNSTHYMVEDQVIHQFLHQTLVEAVRLGASDIHFEPEKFSVCIRCRYDGLLKTVKTFHRSFWKPLCVQLKVLSSMDIAEMRRPQDGRFSFSILGRDVDFRASCHPTLYGENIVLRILDKKKSLISLDTLGYSPGNLSLIKKMIRRPEGIIVVTGPTGSGKTTSLYSMLSVLDCKKLNIMTLEEPVEYHFSSIRQSEVREGSAFHFSSGMHSILRQDPDVILIGEIRDETTAYMAMRAAMTGHMVFTTLHTINALGAIYRLKELQVPLSILAGVLNGIISQRLLRVLCVYCKGASQVSSEEAAYGLEEGAMIYRPSEGCSRCHFSGYLGRKAISEVITVDEEIEGLILNHCSYTQLKESLLRKGFISLRQDGLRSVISGETSIDEFQRVLGG
jgi:type II secretory ATPase GspE/PulE/Tfp pilus assembly ATPase PilB-like protein